jgi:hypothetical protein
VCRSPRVLLPADPGEEELARDFSLSETDKRETRSCRRDDHRRRFALQLCVLRKTGRFLDSYQQVATKILTHLSRQLDLSPVLFLSETERSATEYDYQERIRGYLGWQTFDECAEEQLTRWLQTRGAEGTLPADLLQQAEGLLRSWRVVLPGSSSLETIGRFGGGADAAGSFCPHRRAPATSLIRGSRCPPQCSARRLPFIAVTA